MSTDDNATTASGVLRGAFFVPLPATPYTLTLRDDESTLRALIIDTETTGRGATSEIIESSNKRQDHFPSAMCNQNKKEK